jgi:hypothetical protein
VLPSPNRYDLDAMQSKAREVAYGTGSFAALSVTARFISWPPVMRRQVGIETSPGLVRELYGDFRFDFAGQFPA